MAKIQEKQNEVRVQIYYKAHEKQLEIHRDQTRFRAVCAGRRSGKTMGAVVEALLKGLEATDKRILWLAPYYPATQRGWDLMVRMVNREAIDPHKAEKYIELITGSRIYFGSGDSPSSVLGHGFDLAIIDEAARVPDEVWQAIIRPTLSDKKGGLLAISSPLYKAGWFYQMLVDGQDDQIQDVSYHHFPSSANPFLDDREIESAQMGLPSDIFEREYLAVPQAAGGDVFRGLDKAMIQEDPWPNSPEPGRIYAAGVDLARKSDFTVVTILDVTDMAKGGRARLVALARWNIMSWEEQIQRIANLCRTWECSPVVVDATGLGDVVVESLQYQEALPVEPVVFTAPSKAAMVAKLKVGIESGALHLPSPEKSPEAKQMALELSAYTMTLTGVTGVKYEAPSGLHDDIVASLMLAWSHADLAGVPLAAMVA